MCKCSPPPVGSGAVPAASLRAKLVAPGLALALWGWMGMFPRTLSPRQGTAWMHRGTRSRIHSVSWSKAWSGLLRGGTARAWRDQVTSHSSSWSLVYRRGQAGRSPWQVGHGVGRSTSAGQGAQARCQPSLGTRKAMPRWLCQQLFSPPLGFPTKLLLFSLQFPQRHFRGPSEGLCTATLVLCSALCCQHSKNTTETHRAAAARGSTIGHSYRVLNQV